MLRYTVLIYQDPEERNFGVVVPELPGCVTQGASFDQALANAREAIEGHLIAMAQHGEEIPEEFGVPVMATVEVNPDLAGIHRRTHSQI